MPEGLHGVRRTAGHADRRWGWSRPGASEGISASGKPLVDYYAARPTFRSIDGNQARRGDEAIDSAIVDAVAAGARP
jgi:hypothetical protein